MANDKIIDITPANFEAVVQNSEQPVLIDFWAAWCGPCRAVAPILDELATEMDGKVQIAKINVDENQELASRFNVSGIPAFVLIKDGEVKDRMVGAMPKSSFKEFLTRNV
jgi:thioredoxin 1